MSSVPVALPAPRLYFIHATGCGACEEARPEVEAFARVHNGVRVIAVDLAVAEWKAKTWEPQMTPSYVLLDSEGRRRGMREGLLTEKELEVWVNQALK